MGGVDSERLDVKNIKRGGGDFAGIERGDEFDFLLDRHALVAGLDEVEEGLDRLRVVVDGGPRIAVPFDPLRHGGDGHVEGVDDAEVFPRERERHRCVVERPHRPWREHGLVRRVLVEVGHRSGLAAEIVKGLNDGDTVVAHPDETVEDGKAVSVK